MDFVAGPRVSIAKAFTDEESPDFFDFLEKFQMSRECNVTSFRDAAKYYFFEHLLRSSTLDPEVQASQDYFDGSALRLLEQLLRDKTEEAEETPLHALERRLTSRMLIEIDPQVELEKIIWTGSEFETDSFCVNQPRVPICYVLLYQTKYYILYTANMNWVDGYEPLTGDKYTPIITHSTMESATRTLYFHNPDYNPKKNKPKKKKKKPAKPASPPQPQPQPKVVQAFVEEEKNEEPKNVESPKIDSSQLETRKEPEFKFADEDEEEDRGTRYVINAPLGEPKSWKDFESEAKRAKKHREQCDAFSCNTF